MKKFNLGFNKSDNNFNDKYRRNKNALTCTALIAAASIFLVSSTAFTNQRLEEQIEEDHAQMEELQQQLEELRRQEAENERIRESIELKEKYDNIKEEANEIRAYYNESSQMLDQMVYIDTDLNYDDARREYCEECYGDAIDEIAPKFGLSPNIIRAIATQEGAGHLDNVMQVSSGWLGQKLDYYDYELDRWMKICVTSNPKDNTDECIYISTEDPNWSVYLGCTIFQRGIQYNNGHLFSTFTYYNRGDSAPLVNTVARNEGMTSEEYLEDIYNAAIQYYEYNQYILLVLQFMDENPVEYSYYNPDTEEIENYTIYMTFNNRDAESVISDTLGDAPECEYEENQRLLENSENAFEKELVKFL